MYTFVEWLGCCTTLLGKGVGDVLYCYEGEDPALLLCLVFAGRGGEMRDQGLCEGASVKS